MIRLTVAHARRMALAAQGLHRPPPQGRRLDVRHFRRVLRRLGAVQLDSVNVVARAHYMPFFSRLGPYDRDRLDHWAATSGDSFEYWGHVASMMPAEFYPWFRWRMESIKPWGRVARLARERPDFVAQVRAEVERSPLTISDLEHRGDRDGPWWGNAPGKDALEWLFAKGEVTAVRTGNFVRRYDMPQRVLPARHLEAPPPDREAAYRLLLLEAARALGVATTADLADYYRLNVPVARPVLAAMAAAGELREVSVEGWKGPVYAHPEARLPRRVEGSFLLSPFDSMIWNRDRVERLFDFHYRIEIYVPAAQRRYGYYVYPLLSGGRLVGRFDLKADRKAGALRVLGAYREDGAAPARKAAVRLTALADWLGLDRITVGPRGNLAPALRAALGD